MNDLCRTITICPDCQTIGYGHPNYCITCGRNLMQTEAVQLPDIDATGFLCPRCQMFVPAAANYCSRCGEGLKYPHNYAATPDDTIPMFTQNKKNSPISVQDRSVRDSDEDTYMEELYGPPPWNETHDRQRKTKRQDRAETAMVYASPEAMERRHPPQPVEPQITVVPRNDRKPSLMERLFRKKDGNK